MHTDKSRLISNRKSDGIFSLYHELWRTYHKTVVLLSKGEIDSKNIRVEFSLEDMDMSEFQDGATYSQIKEYALKRRDFYDTL